MYYFEKYLKPNQNRKPIEEMRQAEKSSHFAYKAEATSHKSEEEEEEEESDREDEDDEEDKYANKNNEDSISNLAKQLLKSKLEKTEPITVKTTTSTSKLPDQEKDDLDLELDMELDNVDTTDVNLDDDLSD